MRSFKHLMSCTLDYIGRLICPPHCICCNKQFGIDDDRVFCSSCYEMILSKIVDERTSVSADNSYEIYGFLPYNSWYARKIIAHAKYVSSKSFLHEIGKMASQSLDKHNLLPLIDVITFSPRRKSQVRYYGFDQSYEIAKAISNVTKIPTKPLLQRAGYSFAQKKLNHEARTKNVKNKFICTENLNNQNVLLIDDVVTTGATVFECARMLKENGAKKIYIWSIASKH